VLPSWRYGAPGLDVAWVRVDAPVEGEQQVIARPRTEERVLVTFDLDFGELVLKRGLAASHGVIVVRLPLDRPLNLAHGVAAAIASRDDWPGNFGVDGRDRVRMRPLTG